jgi:hypothetical protein
VTENPYHRCIAAWLLLLSRQQIVKSQTYNLRSQKLNKTSNHKISNFVWAVVGNGRANANINFNYFSYPLHWQLIRKSAPSSKPNLSCSLSSNFRGCKFKINLNFKLFTWNIILKLKHEILNFLMLPEA